MGGTFPSVLLVFLSRFYVVAARSDRTSRLVCLQAPHFLFLLTYFHITLLLCCHLETGREAGGGGGELTMKN